MSVTDVIERFFQNYEKTVADNSFEKTVEYFADTFMLAGPRGAVTMSRAEFLALSRQAAEFYKNVGRTSARILSMNETLITNQYSLVTTHWGLTFEKTGNKVIESDITFLVQKTASEPTILTFIDHQDDEEVYRQLGLLPA